MIINLRGTHGAGKSSVVRALLKKVNSKPLYGLLGPAMPEAYLCVAPGLKKPLYVLGPYDRPATAGFDYVTKKSMKIAVEFSERYARQGHILLESVLVSCRFMEPTIGGWFAQHKKQVINAILTTTDAECNAALADRRTRSIRDGSSKHIELQRHQFGLVTNRLVRDGFRLEYVSRDDAVEKLLGWFREGA